MIILVNKTVKEMANQLSISIEALVIKFHISEITRYIIKEEY